jgi:hypothetical protein
MSHRKAKTKRRHSRGTSSLKQHTRVSKTLLPPLARLGVQEGSWKTKAPELIWVDTLLEEYKLEEAGRIFHHALDILDRFVSDKSPQVLNGLVSSFSLVTIEARAGARQALEEDGFFDVIFPEHFKEAVSLYPECPMTWLFDDWRKNARADYESGLAHMKAATIRLLASHSKHASRCRMLPLSRLAKRGKLVFVKGEVDQLIDDLCAYSDLTAEEDQKRTESSIRAMFGAVFAVSEWDTADWSAYFWRHNYKISLCETVSAPGTEDGDASPIINSAIKRLREPLNNFKTIYKQASRKASLDLFAPDRDDVLFGLTSREFRLFSAIAEDPNLWSWDLGLAIHRMMADTLIILSYLASKNDPALFARFKRYSLGKQKLYKLHLSDFGEQIGIDLSEVEEELADAINAEAFEELLPVELGSVFEGTDMRKMAYEVGLDDLYRLFYSPTSAELHGEWVSLRDHNLTLCSNPLHCFHRLPKLDAPTLVSPSIVIRAASALATTVEVWLRAYGLESQYSTAVDDFRSSISNALDGQSASAASA